MAKQEKKKANVSSKTAKHNVRVVKESPAETKISKQDIDRAVEIALNITSKQ